MRAVVCKELTGPEGLAVEDMPAPAPGPGEVRIRVRAAGVNFADTLIIKGRYQDQPALPFVPGMEIAGRIDACGEGVSDLAPGDRVMAPLAHGGFAELAVCPAGTEKLRSSLAVGQDTIVLSTPKGIAASAPANGGVGMESAGGAP